MADRLADLGVDGGVGGGADGAAGGDATPAEARAQRKQLRAMAHVLVQAAAGVLMEARCAGPADRKRQVAELKRMLERYLAPVLG